MYFVSIEFLLFATLNIIFFKYFKNSFLFHIIFGGFIFYAWFYWPYLFLIIFLCLITFYGTKKLLIIDSKRLFLISLIAIIVTPLIFFKYNYLFFLNSSLRSESTIILFPLGISFITFTMISYVIDCYEKKFVYNQKLKIFFSYIFFFPQMIAGPILRPYQLIPQLIKKRNISFDNSFKFGIALIIIGFVKKVLIADTIGASIDPLLINIETLNLFEKLFIVYGFTIQIYCDFSGYTDIAIGLAKILKINLPFNFKSPYLASNPVNFWRKWHITLSRWFRDYIYFRVSEKNENLTKNLYSVMFTMLLCGMWHGATLNFIIWGCVHGVGIFWIHFIKKKNFFKINKKISILLTFNFVAFCWIFFRIHQVDDILLFFFNSKGINDYVFLEMLRAYTFEIFLIIITILFHKFDRIYFIRFLSKKLNSIFFWSICFFLILIIVLMKENTNNQFIYFDF